jgi:triosephosphate isomerase
MSIRFDSKENAMSRTPVIVGNWKMHKTVPEAIQLARALRVKAGAVRGVEVGVCPPFTALAAVIEAVKETSIGVGAQNMHPDPKGAFTGEIAPGMLVDLGCKYVILGHSERREHFGEKDAFIAKKAKAAHANGLVPIVCVGETLAEREGGATERVVGGQIHGSLEGLSNDEMATTILAYEPVWAIGTGKTATPDQANAVHAFIRDLIAKKFSPAVAASVRIQYGGSVKPDNARTLLSQPDIDGALVGGASLQADDFEAIVKAAA